MKTPGVYIVEKNAFPNSVVEVPTAIPAFIGYTEKHDNNGQSLLDKPTRIGSFADYMRFFGSGPEPKFTIGTTASTDTANPDDGEFKVGADSYYFNQSTPKFYLYNCIRLFYQNGGGPCYIVSVGDYSATEIEAAKLDGTDADIKGLQTLVKEQEPTMVVIPDACGVADNDQFGQIVGQVLDHCGNQMKSRFGIFDVFDGYRERTYDKDTDVIMKFRDIGINYRDFGAAYYPWVNTTVVQDKEIDPLNFVDSLADTITTILTNELAGEDPGDDAKKKEKQDQMKAKIGELNSKVQEYIAAKAKVDDTSQPTTAADMQAYMDLESEVFTLHKTFITLSPAYNTMIGAILDYVNTLPPSAAMAGIYSATDNNRGVWKAPANVAVLSAPSPSVNITHDDQEDLNVDLNGKSINAIRSFIGEGTLVWGARTLDGNSQDWRYVNVRRTMIFLEQSIKIAAKAYVFEPNDAKTWTTMKSMLDNFLTNQWKAGALVGAVPADAFLVQVGLGTTMTANDILDGIMRITVLVAVSRPAEFIEITFQQQMQKS